MILYHKKNINVILWISRTTQLNYYYYYTLVLNIKINIKLNIIQY